jgi:hypothetical protein
MRLDYSVMTTGPRSKPTIGYLGWRVEHVEVFDMVYEVTESPLEFLQTLLKDSYSPSQVAQEMNYRGWKTSSGQQWLPSSVLAADRLQDRLQVIPPTEASEVKETSNSKRSKLRAARRKLLVDTTARGKAPRGMVLGDLQTPAPVVRRTRRPGGLSGTERLFKGAETAIGDPGLPYTFGK